MPTYSQYNQFNIPQVNFSGTVFKPQELKFEAPEASIAQQSLHQYENRVNQANAATTNIEKVSADLKKDLSNDDKTNAWFDNWFGKYRAQIDALSNSGNYGEAMRVANELGAKITKDPEYLKRKEHYNQFKTKLSEIQNNKNLNPETKQRWIETHKYDPDQSLDDGSWGLKDDTFNSIYGDLVVDDINIAQAITEIAGIANPETHTVGTDNTVGTSTNNTDLNGINRQSSSSSMSGRTRQSTKLDLKALKNNREAYIMAHERQIVQLFENDKYFRNKAKERLAKMNPSDSNYKQAKAEVDRYSFLDDGAGGEVNYAEYFRRLTNSQLESIAYTNTSDITKSSNQSATVYDQGTYGGRLWQEKQRKLAEDAAAKAAAASNDAAKGQAVMGYVFEGVSSLMSQGYTEAQAYEMVSKTYHDVTGTDVDAYFGIDKSKVKK